VLDSLERGSSHSDGFAAKHAAGLPETWGGAACAKVFAKAEDGNATTAKLAKITKFPFTFGGPPHRDFRGAPPAPPHSVSPDDDDEGLIGHR
jgi:hypothetical protein